MTFFPFQTSTIFPIGEEDNDALAPNDISWKITDILHLSSVSLSTYMYVYQWNEVTPVF